jgi:hypothetical protein
VDVPSAFRFGILYSQFPLLLRTVIHTIDLTVLNYVKIYLDRFDKEFLGKDITVIDVLTLFADIYELNFPLIKLRRYPFQCLDSFHFN